MFFWEKRGICQFKSMNFYAFPDWFPCFPGRKVPPGLTQGHFLTSINFLGDSSSSPQIAETKCF